MEVLDPVRSLIIKELEYPILGDKEINQFRGDVRKKEKLLYIRQQSRIKDKEVIDAETGI